MADRITGTDDSSSREVELMDFSRKCVGRSAGFSMVELIVAMTVTLVLLGMAATLLSSSLSSRNLESRKSDAQASARAALNLMSREIANSGFGLNTNGIVLADSNGGQLHFRANLNNADATTNAPGEDVTYYHDPSTQSIARSDRFNDPQRSIVVNRVSRLSFRYFDYEPGSSTPVEMFVPSANTARVEITVTVSLQPVAGQADNEVITFSSEIALRNSDFVLKQL